MSNLLAPRFKVIADYPGSPFKVGEILIQANDGGKLFWNKTSDGEWNDKVHNIDQYPYLFKRLEWYEERFMRELPMFLRVVSNNSSLFIDQIVSVDSWGCHGSSLFCYLKDDKPKSLSDFYEYPAEHFVPATKEEYDTYINSKQTP